MLVERMRSSRMAASLKAALRIFGAIVSTASVMRLLVRE